MEEDLREIYEAFCSFGSSRNLSSNDNITGPQMDGAKFAKFARDNKLIDNKKVTGTDVDIIFNKIKPKGARRIEFNQFKEGLAQIGEKRNPGVKGREALDYIRGIVMKRGGGPIASGTSPQSDAIVDRLTDTSKYTGTHKLRFDDSGKGRGAEGRDRPSATSDLSQITNREETSVRGLPVSVDPSEHRLSGNTRSAAAKRSHGNIVTASSERLDHQQSKPKTTKVGSNSNLSKPKTATSHSNSNLKAADKAYGVSAKGGSVFDRLTNTTGYTGTHKERFNADGTGRGIAGRDSPGKGAGAGAGAAQYHGGDVKDLSQILRT